MRHTAAACSPGAAAEGDGLSQCDGPLTTLLYAARLRTKQHSTDTGLCEPLCWPPLTHSRPCSGLRAGNHKGCVTLPRTSHMLVEIHIQQKPCNQLSEDFNMFAWADCIRDLAPPSPLTQIAPAVRSTV
jgi:hypothetical protein